MTSHLRFVFLNTAGVNATTESKLLPSVDSVYRTIALAEENKIDLQIHLFDPNFVYVQRPYNKNPDHHLIEGYPADVIIIHAETYPDWDARMIKGKTQFPDDYDVVFISNKPMSTYHIMDQVETWSVKRRWYVPGPITDIQAFTAKWIKEKPVHYNFFGLGSRIPVIEEGKDTVYIEEKIAPLPASLSALDLQEIRLICIKCTYILRHYLALGFYESKVAPVSYNPPSWVLQPEELANKGFIKEYGLDNQKFDTVLDRDALLLIRSSGNFRLTLAKVMIRCIANFALANGLITLELVTSSGGWKSATLLTRLQRIFMEWDLTSKGVGPLTGLYLPEPPM